MLKSLAMISVVLVAATGPVSVSAVQATPAIHTTNARVQLDARKKAWFAQSVERMLSANAVQQTADR